jgi:hypothetical protein
MQVAFLTEGATEHAVPFGGGGAEPWETSFALQILVERILGIQGRLEACPAGRRRAGAGPILKRGLALLCDAVRQGAGAVILLVDADGRSQERLRRLREHRERAHSKGARFQVPIVVGVAIETIEAWLLADENALARVLGVRERATHTGAPEDLRGKKGGSDDPKARLEEWRSRDRHGPRGFLEQMNAIVREIDLDVVALRCPKGFAPFCEEVRTHLGPLFGPPSSRGRG